MRERWLATGSGRSSLRPFRAVASGNSRGGATVASGMAAPNGDAAKAVRGALEGGGAALFDAAPDDGDCAVDLGCGCGPVRCGSGQQRLRGGSRQRQRHIRWWHGSEKVAGAGGTGREWAEDF